MPPKSSGKPTYLDLKGALGDALESARQFERVLIEMRSERKLQLTPAEQEAWDAAEFAQRRASRMYERIFRP